MKRVELCEKGGGCVYVELDPNHLFLAAHCNGDVDKCGIRMPGAKFSGANIYVPATLAKEWALDALSKVSEGHTLVWLGLMTKISCTTDICVVDDGITEVYTTRQKVIEWLEDLITEISKVV